MVLVRKLKIWTVLVRKNFFGFKSIHQRHSKASKYRRIRVHTRVSLARQVLEDWYLRQSVSRFAKSLFVISRGWLLDYLIKTCTRKLFILILHSNKVTLKYYTFDSFLSVPLCLDTQHPSVQYSDEFGFQVFSI